MPLSAVRCVVVLFIVAVATASRGDVIVGDYFCGWSICLFKLDLNPIVPTFTALTAPIEANTYVAGCVNGNNNQAYLLQGSYDTQFTVTSVNLSTGKPVGTSTQFAIPRKITYVTCDPVWASMIIVTIDETNFFLTFHSVSVSGVVTTKVNMKANQQLALGTANTYAYDHNAHVFYVPYITYPNGQYLITADLSKGSASEKVWGAADKSTFESVGVLSSSVLYGLNGTVSGTGALSHFSHSLSTYDIVNNQFKTISPTAVDTSDFTIDGRSVAMLSTDGSTYSVFGISIDGLRLLSYNTKSGDGVISATIPSAAPPFSFNRFVKNW